MTDMEKFLIDISSIRREYKNKRETFCKLIKNPMDLFKRWLSEAIILIPEATAMIVGTVDENGQSYQRLVLLRYFDESSMVFYTNFNSRKSIHILKNSKISLHFPWHIIDRQILVLGNAEILPIRESINYFYSRPRNNQISTWVSHQSKFISINNFFEKKFIEKKKYFGKNKEIPFPKFWGGYRVNIYAIEFWQGNKYRLHDRLFYQKEGDSWQIDRLSP